MPYLMSFNDTLTKDIVCFGQLGPDYHKINVKKIAFGKKEHTMDSKRGASVLLRLLISSN